MTFKPPNLEGKKYKFKRAKKKDKLEKLLGDRMIGIMTSGDEITILVKKDMELSESDLEKIQKIVDGE